MKLLNIIKGFYYWLNTPAEVAIMSRKRMKICKGCDWKQGPSCGLCGCVLQAKTKVAEEACPALKWKSEK